MSGKRSKLLAWCCFLVAGTMTLVFSWWWAIFGMTEEVGMVSFMTPFGFAALGLLFLMESDIEDY